MEKRIMETHTRKIKPILFSTPMVLALLAGTKTQTRRAIKPQPDISDGRPLEIWYGWPSIARSGTEYHNITPPFGRPGDVLWVRETWTHGYPFTADPYLYRATYEGGAFHKWKPSLFMPRQACRLFLEIVSIRVERLQDISEQDSVAEGVYCYSQDDPEQNDYKNYLYRGDDDWGVVTAKQSYSSLWESINGIGTWNANPFVWAIEFKRINKPADWPS